MTCIKVHDGPAPKNELFLVTTNALKVQRSTEDTDHAMTPEESMNFRPLHDRLLLRRFEEEERSAGGVIIPDTAKEKPMQGEVVAVGPGARDAKGEIVPLDIAVGDRVLIGKWSGTEVKLDGEELLILKESDILAIIENT